ncbi:hypothetical protein OH76DRAFT_1404467, partial [Lentinus brumalis]
MEYVRRFDDSLNAITQQHTMSKPCPTSGTSSMRPSAIPSAPEPSYTHPSSESHKGGVRGVRRYGSDDVKDEAGLCISFEDIEG